MALDFSKLGGVDSSDTVTSPKELFTVLPGKDQRKYKYPRDVQSEVWDQWYQRRNDSHVVIKMNTGGGKTVVGLVILKSCLNEGAGPAVYVCPNPYLTHQVTTEAQSLGIETTDDPRSNRYLRGKAILVTNIYKLINGKSVFGVGDEGIRIPIGSIVVDDAHACLETSEMQFSLTIPTKNAAYSKLLVLFETTLKQQSLSRYMDVAAHHPDKVMQVPFWDWIDRHQDVVQILHAERDSEEFKFIWPLIRNHLQLCHCVFGRGEVEITPRCLPITVIPSFVRATRRIFMSATFSDDSILVTDFDAPVASIMKPITPSRASDIGDRMILVPQEFNPGLTDVQLKQMVKGLSAQWNTAVLVPSDRRLAFWKDVADRVLHSGNLQAGVEELKRGHVGLVVFVNKYDGIDLPDDACRILVVDGIPDVRKKIDKVEQSALWGSDWLVAQAVHRIEQGMGRGVRSTEDYCVVFLMGRTLTNYLYTAAGMSKFTSATKAQLSLSEKVAEQLRGAGVVEVVKAAQSCLQRDTNWVSASRAAVVHVQYEAVKADDGIATAQRTAFNAAAINDYRAATTALQHAVNSATDPILRSWLMQELASYEHFSNPAQAQLILKSAVRLNNQLLLPIEGVEYQKLSAVADQAGECLNYLRGKYGSLNQMVLEMNALLDDMIFRPETSNPFERAVEQVGRLIGFRTQRPENETGVGPDVLWSVGQLRFFVIECKNGCEGNTIAKHDCDQLGGSVRWFEAHYDGACPKIPLLIHPVKTFEHHGTPHPDTRVMTRETLAEFSSALRKFATAVTQNPKFGTKEEVATILEHLKLTPDGIIKTFTLKFASQ